MSNFWSQPGRVNALLLALGAGMLMLGVILYFCRANYPMLYYYGPSPEVPGGTAIPVLNPFRSRRDEANAEWLIRDLSTARCEPISSGMHADPRRVCRALGNHTSASLIWLDAQKDGATGGVSRNLSYDLRESHSRLVVYFGYTEAGWGVSRVRLLQ